MNDRNIASVLALSISAVERDTGLSKDTLRVWERRYGFPMPERDAFGERIYPTDQVEKLRIVKRLMDAGHRPGKIISLGIDELQALSELSSAGARSATLIQGSEDLQSYLEIIKRHQIEEFRRTMTQAVLRVGLHRFVTEIVAPLTTMVGEAWARGYFEIFEEHLYTEAIQVVMRSAIATIPIPAKRPRIILTTLPNELHGLGLLMAEAIFSLEGSRCLSLGTQTPIWDIALAATTQRADIVALSFSSAQSNNSTLDSLNDLRVKLPRSTEIWCGGGSSLLRRRPPVGVRVLESFDELVSAVAQWRAVHGS
jgi:DNA-binding transcriptional MerR regulator